jgi:excisionase family DNA binding protein
MVARKSAKPARYLSLDEVAEINNVSRRTVRRWIADGTLPAYRIGKRNLGIKPEDNAKMAVRIPTA